MSDARDHYLPLRRADLVALCAADPRLPDGDRAAFQDFARILQSVFHYEYHARLEELKQSHAPFDPDRDAVEVAEPDAAELEQRQTELFSGLAALLHAANYESIPQAMLASSLRGESLFRVRLAIDFDDFAQLLLYRRGATERRETIRSWGGLRKRQVVFVEYHRVVLLLRFRDADHFAARGRKRLPFAPGTTVLKLFRSVPAADLEMLFPNTEVRMKPVDMLMIGVPAIVSGVAVLVNKLLGTLLLVGALLAFWLGLRREEVVLDQTKLVALGVGLATLGGYVWQQVGRFRTRKIRFLKALTENLYFKSLDNNAGVLHRLLDDAEEEETKEALLAYWFLLTAAQPLTGNEVDRGVEAWLAQRGVDVDFDIADAATKLVRLGLVARDGDRWRALSLAQAKAALDRAWDGYFAFNGPGPAPA